MPIQAGKLRHRIQLQSPYQVQNSNGEMDAGWQNEGSPVWAAIEPVSVKEFVQSQATQSGVDTRITIRAGKAVQPDWRAVHSRTGKPDVIYNIRGVLADKDSGDEYLSLPCTTGVSKGL